MSKRARRAIYISSAINIGALIFMGSVGAMLYPWRMLESALCVFLALVGAVFNVTETIVLTSEDDTTGGSNGSVSKPRR